MPWSVATGFVRLTTHPRVLAAPVSPAEAVRRLRRVFGYGHVEPLNPGPEHLAHLQRCLDAAGVGGEVVTDADIAALAMEYQAVVHPTDADFGRFPGLRWRNPLKGAEATAPESRKP